MKYLFIVITFLLYAYMSNAQSIAGITGIPDTTFNINSEYRKLQKNYPYLQIANEYKSANIIRRTDIVYCKDGQRELLLDVFCSKLKKQKIRRTAIVFIHGGGWRSGNRSIHYPLAQRLAALGYVCITPEYRLSTEALYPAGVYDIKAAIQWVKKNATQFNIDTTKIVVAGHSAGGELAAFMGTTNGINSFDGNQCNQKYSSRINAVINIDGTLAFIHPESGEGDDSKRPSAATYWFGYSKTENPEIWKEAAPLTHVGPHTPPVLFLNSSVARMHAGREDFIKILDQFSIYNEVKTFEGSPHSFILFNPWLDSAVAYIDNFLKKVFTRIQFKTPEDKAIKVQTIIVAQDGTGDFTKIQQAFNAVPFNNQKMIVMRIKSGIYKKKLFPDSTKNYISLMGDDKFKTILTYNDHTGKLSASGDIIDTKSSWSFKIMADDFLVSNITFQNNARFIAEQAVVVESDGDRIILTDCQFYGNQNILFLNSVKSRQIFQLCYFEGTTDFIFDSSTASFQNCKIYSKKSLYVTSASTPI